MPPYKEKEPEKIFYTIGEVAKIFKVNTSLVRFWEKEFDILKPKKNKKGNRLFTKQDLDNLHIIYHLVKERGFKLDGAKKKLKQSHDEVVNSLEMVKALKNIRSFLVEMKESL
ncbi:MAG: MerR family transcriptional regulator [Bacteroidetes bacterium]|nr:MerR family transcriptional regulator [Bacteroidota bacterium]